ncbi:MAG TPA: YdeI/OmpD-associated family protein [Steroidobacteraceae bacterium]|nr:YdeI/OmpD-associated family protein [Steroidobacteraceae bacterium]
MTAVNVSDTSTDPQRSKLGTLQVHDRKQWRLWLTKNHATSNGVWLVYYKGHTAVKSIPYEHSLREALCFGWIDSLIKRLDDDRYARKFTPRKPQSKWSQTNRKLWARLKREGLLEPAGLARAPTQNHYGRRPDIPELPAYMARALRANPTAWRFFQGLARTYQRPFVMWVHTAKRQATREKRLHEAITLLASGKKLGLK